MEEVPPLLFLLINHCNDRLCDGPGLDHIFKAFAISHGISLMGIALARHCRATGAGALLQVRVPASHDELRIALQILAAIYSSPTESRGRAEDESERDRDRLNRNLGGSGSGRRVPRRIPRDSDEEQNVSDSDDQRPRDDGGFDETDLP
jgi:hypothetical protein